MPVSPLPDALDDLADVLRALGVDPLGDKSSADLIQPDGYAVAMVEAVVCFLSDGSFLHRRPCPFCGLDALQLDGAAFCDNCRAAVPATEDGRFLGDDEAVPEIVAGIYGVKGWNRRSEAEAPACPWCGSPDEKPVTRFDDGVFYASCLTCLGEGPQAGTPEAAQQLWNKRA